MQPKLGEEFLLGENKQAPTFCEGLFSGDVLAQSEVPSFQYCQR